MDFDLDQRTARLSVGEFSEFTLGPRDSTGGPSGLWRAQLGTHWHNQLRAQTTAERSDALFEIPITGRVVHHGWTLTLTGRIDQLIPGERAITLREIKTVTRELPADDTELRAAYPSYLIQIATYSALARFDPSALPAKTPPADQQKCHVIRDTPAEVPLPLAFPQRAIHAELHFVEVASGLAQTLTLTSADDVLFRAQLERVCEFLDLRLRARGRLRNLRFRPPFTELRAGQETTQVDLAAALAKHPIVLFEAPTGFGKTGALLELALTQLRSGRCERVIYLTSKATGQLQVMRTLGHMTEPAHTPASAAPIENRVTERSDSSASKIKNPAATPVTAWLVRPKHEHCVNSVFHCSREVCAYLNGAEARWPKSGLSRFYLFENEPRDIASLRAAGRAAQICPYEITRAALPFNDVWIGDYNYVFSPSTRGLFYEQPGFDASRTLLIIDEAHNLPSRVADVYSHTFNAADASALVEALHRLRVPQKLVQAADHWSHFLRQRDARDALSLADEDDARELLAALASLITVTPLDTQELGQPLAELLWQIPTCIDLLNTVDVPRLWWSPRDRELVITCLDAAAAIGPTLRSFNAVLLASATLTPTATFAAAIGLDSPPALSALDLPPSDLPPPPDRLGALNKRTTKKLFKQLTSAADLLKVEEARELAAPTLIRAHAPWRDHAFDVAIDARVDTSYQHRARHSATTAATVATLVSASRTTHSPHLPSSGSSPTGHWSLVTGHSGKNAATAAAVAAFFPSYAYAETIQRELAAAYPEMRVALQPRLPDLAAQTAWVEQALTSSDILFLVLGSSFAEGIDLLGGRISHAMVIGPALPEVNAVQRARLAAFAPLGRDAAAQRVYQIPGIQKVNQALGRLVRAPGQNAKILLHCRRFAEESYLRLLAPEYRTSHILTEDTDLTDWL
jgi:DNA excision repair protein ERCC-2